VKTLKTKNKLAAFVVVLALVSTMFFSLASSAYAWDWRVATGKGAAGYGISWYMSRYWGWNYGAFWWPWWAGAKPVY
jgi:uncharacterized membrane protein YjjB (DUF3815 family)